ncbi:hypothetical protein OG458_41590 (plasmid) [Streptomyces sp. NBC_01281]|nr:hypothetical protein OG458_41590 [Streptomyces sp. NBC_01281]
MRVSVDVLLVAAVVFAALAVALDLWSRSVQLRLAAVTIFALGFAAIWQERPVYYGAVWGAAAGFLLLVWLRARIRKAAKNDSKPTV